MTVNWGGVIGGGLVAFFIIGGCLNSMRKRRNTRLRRIKAKRDMESRVVEVPTRPQPLRRPPHLISQPQPGPSNPTSPPVSRPSHIETPEVSRTSEAWARAFETMATAIRQGNPNRQENTPGFHYPPQPQYAPPPEPPAYDVPGVSSPHLPLPAPAAYMPHPPSAASSHIVLPIPPAAHQPSASSSHIPLPVPTAATTPTNQVSSEEVAALRSEIEQLRREHQQMQVDSGPAEPPPAYDEDLYIP
ncbi:hypothetical protein H0H92_002172 [Tricholoma furcatifolium]|nr:hypothetical protein H0H92_002172 [Tricholoma furcatifolium]